MSGSGKFNMDAYLQLWANEFWFHLLIVAPLVLLVVWGTQYIWERTGVTIGVAVALVVLMFVLARYTPISIGMGVLVALAAAAVVGSFVRYRRGMKK